jgi:hypothetical protein
MPTTKTMKLSSSETPIGDSYQQDNQYEQYLSEHAKDYDTNENLLLEESEQLFNKMVEESMNMCSIKNTESSVSSVFTATT